MKKEVIKIGNSLALIIPSAVAKQANLHAGDTVMVEAVDQAISIRRTNLVAPIDLRGKALRSKVTMQDIRQGRRAMTRAVMKKWNAT